LAIRAAPQVVPLDRRGDLDHLLAAARGGVGGSLVLRGGPATGTAALLEYAAGQAAGMRFARVAGVESETALGFAALHQLLSPFLTRLDRVPEPQRDALRAAFGLVAAPAPDLFLVGLAALTLLADVAADQPLVVAVDDAQWLDEVTVGVLAFVARRLRAYPIAFLIAVRQPADRCRPLHGLPEVDLAGPPGPTAGSVPRATSGLALGQFGLASPALVDADGLADLLVLSWRGQEAEVRSAAEDQARSGVGVTMAHYALVILELGLGRYEAALAWALNVYRDDPPDLGTHVLPDLVEAATRSGNPDAARSALERLSERATAGATPLGGGLLARSRALLADDGAAEGLYRDAIDQLGRPDAAMHLARSRLVYGEWLRRRRRRRDAREQLAGARDIFDALGAEAFARRAWVELQATSERVGSRTGRASDQLTPQETQIAGLVAEGFSNRQIAAQLFISQNTVEYHLLKVFRKVGVSSRTQLARALLDPAAAC
jgi:DNA-binding CsgD family transcriptional regulator